MSATKPRDKRKRRPRPAWKSTTVVRWSVDARGCVIEVRSEVRHG